MSLEMSVYESIDAGDAKRNDTRERAWRKDQSPLGRTVQLRRVLSEDGAMVRISNWYCIGNVAVCLGLCRARALLPVNTDREQYRQNDFNLVGPATACRSLARYSAGSAGRSARAT